MSLDVAGWVLPNTGSVGRVEILAGGRVLGETLLDRSRPDLAMVYPDEPDAARAGFRVRVTVEEPPVGGEVVVEAVLDDDRRVPVGAVLVREIDDELQLSLLDQTADTPISRASAIQASEVGPISPRDEMFAGDLDHYLMVGRVGPDAHSDGARHGRGRRSNS